jgi:hypothetical protein
LQESCNLRELAKLKDVRIRLEFRKLEDLGLFLIEIMQDRMENSNSQREKQHFLDSLSRAIFVPKLS